jgi:phosphonate transport system substrate-binding protein
MLKSGQLDFAWICGLPYIRNSSWLEVIATAQNAFNKGRPLYRSLVIVAKDSNYKSMLDLKGKIYAFADPDSNSGHLVPRYLLSRIGTNPDDFFMAHMFTYSHSNVVRAVAEGLVDGGSVDSYVLNMLALDEPQLASQVRVIEKSDEFAFPPVVSRKGVAPALVRLVRSTLLNMGADSQGRELLRTLHLTGFSVSSFELYQPIAEMDEEIFSVRPHHDVPTSRANGQ